FIFHLRLFSYLYANRRLFLCHATVPSPIYTLSLHDALPIYENSSRFNPSAYAIIPKRRLSAFLDASRWNSIRWKILAEFTSTVGDRKSTRLNSSHVSISYAVFCLNKKNWMTSIRINNSLDHC